MIQCHSGAATREDNCVRIVQRWCRRHALQGQGEDQPEGRVQPPRRHGQSRRTVLGRSAQHSLLSYASSSSAPIELAVFHLITVAGEEAAEPEFPGLQGERVGDGLVDQVHQGHGWAALQGGASGRPKEWPGQFRSHDRFASFDCTLR